MQELVFLERILVFNYKMLCFDSWLLEQNCSQKKNEKFQEQGLYIEAWQASLDNSFGPMKKVAR